MSIGKKLPHPPGAVPAGDEGFSVRDRLLQKISEDTDLPALGSSVSRVVQLASSDDEAVRNLAYYVLSDVALTQKILRISNTVIYRSYSGAPVTTVSKAIFLLGFDMVKVSALALLLVEGMSGGRAQSVRAELAQALSASIIGRELARRSHFKNAEEASIAALFKNMGRLLVASHDHILYSEIAALIESGSQSPTQAAMQLMGCSFDFLAEAVLREWQIPDTIVNAISPLPQGVLKPAKTRQEWMQQVATFSAAAAMLIPRMNDKSADAACKALLIRFGEALNLDRDGLTQLLATAAQEAQLLADQAKPARRQADSGGDVDTKDSEREQSDDDALAETTESGLPSELLMAIAENSDKLKANACHLSGKPINAREQLMAGIQDLTEMMASGRCNPNDLIMLALEIIYRSMGFRFATICLKDIKTDQFRARISLGENNAFRQAGIVFPAAPSRDLFHLAMTNDADLVISDSWGVNIHELIPAWHRKLLADARSFIVLPLVVQKKPIGFFYGDRTQPSPEGVPQDEAALIKILKGQVLAALNYR
ncbi:MAG: HDOD domain-containing protein [Burkholderiales bacterium]